ncbi:tetratricopeptide repeat protein [Xanthomonas melonis]|uniref:Tetratricopeptide repeat protein n=1 Tax=Xanthomonas melonis TaxID=56456 RepID=A0A2S7DCU4_9XANT|nr:MULTISPECIES: tetratricopeptide repeat protein [Xanthomonas]MCC4586869.1 tetratricopeptide repeat protein [Xanthomonas sp. NCPPB 1067]MCC4600981.1 tetratricopeptide repeat protein [Xanthomonas melonis]MCD0247058.1 tetratricopeptide repeat protein [Xanthomonas melonis]MCD0259368.1 tetratricopeptide repeat protein [Xanthomonas melonis]MCD0268117.1 tetratricopeptide repeat protein [Xanthomonas melonis]
MTPLLLISLLLQAACCVHVVRSGRPLYWIFLLLAFSLLAVLVYVFVAVIPDLRNDPGARRSLKRVRNTLDPQREQRDASRRLDVADTPENRRQLAESLLARGDYAQAAEHYQGALRGLYRDDPHLMLGLARAQFGLGQAQQARQTLDALIAANPGFRSHDGHLLYARAVEDCGDTDAALHEYETLAQGYPGEEARVRYAQLLHRMGRGDQARAVYEQVLRHAAASPKHYQREQRAWVDLARKGLRELDTGA